MNGYMGKKGTVSWSGGKDSALALYKAERSGIEIVNLVTFAPKGAEFRSHPLSFLNAQAEALRLPYYILNIEQPYDINYEKQLNYLREKTGISVIITGDISEVEGYPNWMSERCKSINLEILLLLWHSDRLELLKTLVKEKFEIVFSCVKEPWFTKHWVGKRLNGSTLKELISLTQKNNFDLCGEQGEYHTLVLDAPNFKKRINLLDYSVSSEGNAHYLKTKEFYLQDK